MNPADRPAVSAWIALGANLGDARTTAQQAIRDLGQLAQTQLVAQSSLYLSAPMDADGPDFINAVAQVATTLSPQQLLAALQQLELAAGRERAYRNAPRTLDLDILLYGDITLDTPKLVIPHPRMWGRAFVLLPLAEIASARVSAEQLQAVAAQSVTRLGH